jgi:hypothetical protein
MVKRTSGQNPASEAGETQRKSQSRSARATTPAAAASERGGEPVGSRADELPDIPEPGDVADQAQRSEPTTSPESMASRSARSESMAPGNDRSEPMESENTKSESMASEPSEEDIRLRAYHRYLERGGWHGAHFDDWIEAERELKGKHSDNDAGETEQDQTGTGSSRRNRE